MNRSAIAILLLCLSSAAYAQSEGSPPSASSHGAFAGYSALWAGRFGPVNPYHVVASANSCAPDDAAAVWGPGQTLRRLYLLQQPERKMGFLRRAVRRRAASKRQRRLSVE